jgi:hypothetical protein
VKRLLLMFAVLAAAAYVGCKQGDGDRCQVDDDCASGVCNKAKGTCALDQNTMDTDGSIIIDAPIEIDAPAADAAADTPTD